MEPENEPRPCHNQLEVHPQEGTPEIRLQKKQIHTVRDLVAIADQHTGQAMIGRGCFEALAFSGIA
jgi:hypothetical protein